MGIFRKSKQDNNSILKFLLDRTEVATQYLYFDNPQKSKFEILLLQCTYASLFTNTHYPFVSDKFDEYIRERLNEYINSNRLCDHIVADFLSVNNFLLNRVSIYSNDIKSLQHEIPDADNYTLPIDAYLAIAESPLERIFKNEEISNPAKLNKILKLKNVVRGLISAMNEGLPAKIENQFGAKKVVSFGSFEDIDFNYLSLFEDFCPNCGRFYSRIEMTTRVVNEYEIGFQGEMKSCKFCLEYENGSKGVFNNPIDDLSF